MRFESVTIHAFGKFRDRTLRLAPGMVIFYGPNESGKSTWHAALSAALCGIRRGRGRNNEVRLFAERHQPWDSPDTWEVSAIVRLADDRRIEFRQELINRMDCSARDADLGRDCTQEIIFEGTPDGSQFLGLNRRSFQAVACVKQSEILAIAENAQNLQEDLQRAADTARTDSTAARAIERIDAFHSENVGFDRKGSSKPLPRAKVQHEEAKKVLSHAREQHAGFLELLETAEKRKCQERDAHDRLRLAEAALARRRATAARHRITRAAELAASFPDGPPAPLKVREEVSQRVSTAMQKWRDRPEIPNHPEGSLEGIQRKLEQLPEAPTGELEPDPAVEEAWSRYDHFRAALRSHREMRPAQPTFPPVGDTTEDELRRDADILSDPQPQLDAALVEEETQLQRQLETLKLRGSRESKLLVVCGALGVLGLALIVLGWVLPNQLSLMSGILSAVAAAGGLLRWLVKRDAAAAVRAHERLREVQDQLGEERFRAREWKKRRASALRRLNERNLPLGSDDLRELADELEAAKAAQRDFERWQDRDEQLKTQRTTTERQLVEQLTGRTEVKSRTAAQAMAQYRDECRKRNRQANAAARRPALEAELRAAKEDHARRDSARDAIREVAQMLGITGDDDEALVEGLSGWQRNRRRELEDRDRAMSEWNELATLLDGQTIDDLMRRADDLEQAAQQSTEFLTEEQIRTLPVDSPTLEEEVERRRAEWGRARGDWENITGQVQERKAYLPSVAEAEEQLEAARDELNRIQNLEQVLQLTRGFLAAAQDRVHRDIAPVLAETVGRFLPQVTGGRYQQVTVDPQSLDVQVLEDNRWRQAALLSQGTSEQVYLLLRVALAQHLTKPGESCPLLLDDVTVHSDPERTEAILRVLHVLSEEQQVILFTQEPEVLEWAESHLHEPVNRIVNLSALAVSEAAL